MGSVACALVLVGVLAACSKPDAAEPKTDPPGTCPESATRYAMIQGGTCLEAAVLGGQTVAVCARYLESQGWVRDMDAEHAVGAQTGKELRCYAAPAAD